MTIAQCGECRFYIKIGMECRRHAPKSDFCKPDAWPHTCPDDWCGDFEQRQEPTVE
jgi:hypothetical protein